MRQKAVVAGITAATRRTVRKRFDIVTVLSISRCMARLPSNGCKLTWKVCTSRQAHCAKNGRYYGRTKKTAALSKHCE